MVLYVKASIRSAGKNLWVHPFYVTEGEPYYRNRRPRTSCADPDCLIYVDILDETSIVPSSITITVKGASAYASGAFVAPYNGPSSSISTTTYGSDTGYRVVIDKTSSYSGIITVRVQAADSSGNELDTSWNFTVDSTPPYLTDLSPEDSGWGCTNTLVYYDILDVCTGVKENTLDAYVDGYWAIRKGIFADAYNGPASAITPISVGGQDGYEVCIDNLGTYTSSPIVMDAYGEDGYGNALWDTWEFNIDHTPPVIDGYSYSNTSYTDITFNIKDNETGISQVSIDAYVDGYWAYDGATDTFKSPYATSSTISAVTDGYQLVLVNDNEDYTGTVYIDAYATDVCGNARAPSSWSFTVDAVPPYVDGYSPDFADGYALITSSIVITMKDDETAVNPLTIDAYVDGLWAYDGSTDTFKDGYSGSLSTVVDGYQLTISKSSGRYEVPKVNVEVYFTDRNLNSANEDWDWWTLPDWSSTDYDANDYHSNITRPYMRGVANEITPSVTATGYTHGATVVNIGYLGMTYHPNTDRIYFVPYGQANQTNWHYVDSDGYVTAYAHGLGGDAPASSAYWGGAVHSNGRLYFAPFGQADESKWHYIDTDGYAVAYEHGLGADTPVNNAYIGAVYHTGLKRLYFVPFIQGDETKWHYIDEDGNAVAYTTGLSGGDLPDSINCYIGGVYHPGTERIYLVPYRQAGYAKWHYIDSDGSVVAYTHGLSGIGTNGFSGGFYHAETDRVYFIPHGESDEANWVYIDSSGNANHYAHGLGADTPTAAGYHSGSYAPDGRIYFAPYGQSDESKWHYIDEDGDAVAYAHGLGALTNLAYVGGAYHPSTKRVYFAPRSIATSSTWHYIQINADPNWDDIFLGSNLYNKY